MEFLEKLGIDWRLLIAQIVNFLILLTVLYKLLYKPVLKMLNDRTTRIEKSLADAAKIESNVKQADEERMQKIVEARKEAQKIIEEAKKEAEKVKQDLVAEARQEAEKILTAGKTQLEAEKENVLKGIRKEVAGLVIAGTEQVLQDIVDDNMHKAITEATMRRVGRA